MKSTRDGAAPRGKHGREGLHGLLVRLGGTLALAALLVGCAAQRTYEEGVRLISSGQVEPGLMKIEESVRMAPTRAEYRIALVNQRAEATTRLLTLADKDRVALRFDQAAAAYERILALEPDNLLAQQGLRATNMDRRHAVELARAEGRLEADAGGVAEAGDIVRAILAENPENRRAAALKARIATRREAVAGDGARLAAAFRKPIALQFNDAPLKTVFDFIAQASGLNFLFDREVRTDLRATLNVKNSSVEDVVNLILTTNQLEQRVLNANSVLIYPATAQKLQDYQALAIRTFYVANADVKTIANTLKTMAKVRDIVVDERLGLVMVRGTPELIKLAERLVSLQDQPDPEVMLEIAVLEVQRSRLLELGVQWPDRLSLSPLVGRDQALTLSQLGHLRPSRILATVGAVNIKVTGQDQDANILANPRIRVRNKEKAKVLVGERLPVITTTSTATGFVSESVNYVDVGLKLEVEPTIYLGNDVAIKISLEVSNVTGQTTSATGSVSYQLGTRNASTLLQLHDGETQILAGLISEQDRSSAAKIPALGDIPVVGRLFGAQKSDDSRSEILLSITPRVVRSLRRADLSDAHIDAGTEGAPGSERLRLLPVDAQPGAPRP